LFPREHGASMELLFPLLSAFALGAPTLAAIGLAVGAILAFVSNEAVLVLLGRRGERQRVERGGEARRLLVILLTASALCAAYALLEMSTPARIAALVPALLAVPAIAVALRGESQRTLPVQAVVGVTLASVALPVAIDSGLSIARASALVTVWSVCHLLGTVAARGVLYRSKDGGRGLRIARAAGVLALAGSLAAVGMGVPSGWALAWIALAPLPWAIAAVWLSAFPPPPTRMRALGMSLVGASIVSTTMVLALPW